MGKLTKAGAEARHFLSSFRTLIRMSEMVDELSGYESEAGVFAKEVKHSKAEIKRLKPELEKLRAGVKEAEKVIEASHAKAAHIQKLAQNDAGVIRASASDDLRIQQEQERQTLKGLQQLSADERTSFNAWRTAAEQTRAEIIAQTETLAEALQALRAKLL